ncbi:MAG: hypothetical protein JW873_02795 [Candidatus Saganbacteria bacterium]|nr:hypothetical protein [Candidatus Saganbacteria bacterium]
MIKKFAASLLIVSLLAPALFADEQAEQAYVNQLTYRHNKLELTTQTKTVDVSSSYSNTDITTSNYNFSRNYQQSNTSIATSMLNKAEQQARTDWYIYKGGVEQLSDLEFLELVGDQATYDQVSAKNEGRRFWRRTGNLTIGLGLLAMIGGAAMQSSQPVIVGGALVTTLGFFISAFNAGPRHYISPGYALNKIDDYNLNLKKQLGLPLNFE